MVKFSNFTVQLVLLACLFALYSCDKVKDTTKTEINVESASIELDEITVSATKSTAGDLNPFAASQIIKLEDIQGMSSDAVKHRSNIESAQVGPVSIEITTTDDNGTVVQNLVLQATGIDSNYTVTEYKLGEVYSPDMEKLQKFANLVLMKLFVSDSVEVSAAGVTDIISGEKLRIKITMKDIKLTAKLL